VPLPSSVRILFYTVPQDMRRSSDTLALVAQQVLGEDPQSGSLYVFVGKSATSTASSTSRRSSSVASSRWGSWAAALVYSMPLVLWLLGS
jgi:hypothetical protein